MRGYVPLVIGDTMTGDGLLRKTMALPLRVGGIGATVVSHILQREA